MGFVRQLNDALSFEVDEHTASHSIFQIKVKNRHLELASLMNS